MKIIMENLKKLHEALSTCIHPQTFPVAIKMVTSEDKLPEKVKMPFQDLKIHVTVCQGIAISRRYGWVVGMGREDMSCPWGAITFGFLPAKSKYLDGSLPVQNWLLSKKARANSAQGLPRLTYGKYNHLIVAPLQRAEFQPDTILIYGNPAQMGRLVQAAICNTGMPLNWQSFGGPDCANITKTLLSDEYQLILPAGGEHVYALVQDDEMAFTIPITNVDEFTEGLKATHEAGQRYPVPSFLRFEAEFPQPNVELMKYLKEE